MRDDVMWSPVIAGLAEGCWADNRQQARHFKHELASMSKLDCRVLPASVGRRLRACFAPLVSSLPCRCAQKALLAKLCSASLRCLLVIMLMLQGLHIRSTLGFAGRIPHVVLYLYNCLFLSMTCGCPCQMCELHITKGAPFSAYLGIP